MKFTQRMIEALKPKDKRYEVWETGRNGFGIRVSTKGKKSWLYMYWFENKKRRMTLGAYPMMGLSEAHSAHAAAEDRRDNGFDPGKEKVDGNKDARLAPTVSDLIDEYLSSTNKRSVNEDRRIFEKDIKPKLGMKKAKDVKRRDVIVLLDEIVKRGAPIGANRTLAATRRLYNWAIGRDIVDFNPCIAIEAPGVEKSRDRVLSEDEIIIFWDGLSNAQMLKSVALILKFQLVTLQRKGEVVTLEWSEIDGNMWTIPASKAKNNMAHRVPLSDMALKILKEAKSIKSEENWVFPSRIHGKGLTSSSINRSLLRNREIIGIANITPHDLRRTGASSMASMGIPRLHISKILNHVESGITAVYDRHSYDAEKRHALDVWAKKLNGIVLDEIVPENVVKLK